MNKQPKKTVLCLLCALLPAAAVTAALALSGVCPFGSKSMGILDMSNQYLSFLASLRDLLTGKASALYLPSMALGGNMTGVLAYYLMSPLNLLVCLFPKEELLTAVCLLFILRVGLCGLTMGLYAGSRRGWGWRVLVPALAYGLMAYTVAYSTNYQWIDGLILLPLIALGIARIAEGKPGWLYILALGGALISNFYIGYILCLFSVLFFLGELLSTPNLRRSRPGHTLIRFALASLGAGALAAFLLIPTFLSLRGGKAGIDSAAFSQGSDFSFPAFFSKLFPGAFNYDELTPVGRPNIYCGSVTAALAVLYFCNRAIPRRRRAATGALLAALVISFCVPALDLIWHGMNVPTWLNYRYSFLFSFLLAAASDAELASLREGTRPWQLLLPVGVTALLGVIAFLGQSYSYVTWHAAVGGGAVTAGACVLLWLSLRPKTGPRLAAAACAAAVLLHAGELTANAKLSFDQLFASSSDPAAWAAYVSEKGAAMALADTGDQLVRVDSPDSFSQNRCEPMLFDYDGLSHYSSNVAQKNLDFLERMGLSRYNGLYALYHGGVTAGADSLLAVGYVVAADMPKPYTALASAGRYTAYANPYALPVGWTADSAMDGSAQGEDPFAYTQALFDAAAPEVGQALYIPARAQAPDLDGLTDAGDGRYVLDSALSGSLTYTVTPQADGPLYGYLDFAGYPGVMVYVNGAFSAYYATGQTNGSLYLGTFSAGEAVSVRVQAALDVTVGRTAFVTEDIRALAAYHSALSGGGCPLAKLSDAHFAGSFTTGEGDSLLVLTIPYDEGWRITLDGQAAQAHEIQDCLTALDVTAGAHTLDMRYIPAGLPAGIGVSVLTAALLAAVYFRSRRKSA